MITRNMTIKEVLNYAKPQTELEIILYERLKDAQDEISDLEDMVPSCGPIEIV